MTKISFDKVRESIENFDNKSSQELTSTISQIKEHLRSDLTKKYLSEKITKLDSLGSESEKKEFLRTLLPYFKWYLQGSSEK